MKRAIWISAAAVLALAACSKKAAETGQTATASATAPAAPAEPAAPATPPPRRAGLWEQKISTGSMQQTMKFCLDASVDQKMKWWGSQAKGKSDCTEQSVRPHPGGGWDFHAVCPMGESGTVTSDGSATGDFGSHYKVEVTSVTTGSPMAQANGTHKTSIEATWTGPCPADMKAGDMEMPGGMRINMTDAMNGASAKGYAGGRPSAAEIAKMRAQAMEMAKSMKEKQ